MSPLALLISPSAPFVLPFVLSFAPLIAALALLIAPVAARAQARDVLGQVLRQSAKGGEPVAGSWVTLHRVGRDRRGPLDSVRTDAAGRYSFRYRTSGDTAALYFVSSRYAGIAYFTPPFRQPKVRGGDADLLVYDTTDTAIPIRVRGHHVIIAALDSAKVRTVVEVYELSNDTSVTRVASPGGGATFEAPLPAGATNARAGEGDITREAVSFAGGRIRVAAPIAPGIKQLSFEYRLPAGPAPIAFPPVGTTVLEVLVEDPKGSAEGAGLKEVDPVVVESRSFRRFLATDVPANAKVSVRAPTSGSSAPSMRIALAVTSLGAVLLAWLAASFLRGGPLAGRPRVQEDPDALAREIASLDRTFELKTAPTPAERADHYEARARLKARLTAALARRDGLA